ncbi:MAG: HU family DNA-binding protein [Desulfovibrio sp.]|nr:HU family DNA-binding protein [Desulfovibrio sp.]MCA1986087.1 HU family DNA-binding protein [Desulfovibrio sp.]
MNFFNFTRDVAEKTGQSHATVDAVLRGSLEHIREVVAKGQEVRLPGLGVFATKARKARQGRNPRTGEAIQIPAKKAPAFRPAAQFEGAVNA